MEYKTVFTGTPSEADAVRMKLESNDIYVAFLNKNFSSIYGSMASIHPVDVQVRLGDIERAVEILECQEDRSQEPEWICPACNETIEGQFTDCWNCTGA